MAINEDSDIIDRTGAFLSRYFNRRQRSSKTELTGDPITVLEHAEALLDHYFNLPEGSLDADMAKEFFVMIMVPLTDVAKSFKGTEHESRFIRAANGIIEGAYRVGHPNSLKEGSASKAMNAIFPEIKISGEDLELEARYSDKSTLPPRRDLT